MTYTVDLEHQADGWWIARVQNVKGVHSNGRSIDEALRRVREALTLAVDDADEAELLPNVKLPSNVRALIQRQAAAKERAERESIVATELRVEAASKLVNDLGLSLRDAGQLLGVSHAMVSKTLRPRKNELEKIAKLRASGR